MSSNLKLIPGRYTKSGAYAGEVRYPDPSVGVLYEDAEGKRPANNGFMPRRAALAGKVQEVAVNS